MELQNERRPPDGLTIRATRPGDAEALADLMNQPGFRCGTLRLPYHSPEEVRAWIERDWKGALSLVAELEGRIVGQAGLRMHSGRRMHAGQIGMGVHDAWQGRGIGRALLAALVEAADRWLNLRRLELTVFTDNAPAIALYRSFGFELEGTHRDFAFRDGAFADAHAMARIRKG
jgi:L-phenylalanine/L-methionine N-acetyltransferase